MKSSRFHHALLGAAVTAAALSAQAVFAAPPTFTGLFVFGDSLSDSGNNAIIGGTNAGQVITGNTYVPSQPYGFGAYTNGQTWVNSFAAGLGLPAFGVPSLGGGGNFAYGGARTVLNGTDVPSAPGFPPSATTQLLGGPSALPYMNGYLTSLASVPATALYVIAIGGNDVRDLSVSVALGGTSPAAVPGLAANYANAVGNMVDALQAKGAQSIVVWGTPNVGATPAALSGGPAFSGLASNISVAFSGALQARVAGEAGVTFFDVFNITSGIIANPGAYGLSNVTDACGFAGNNCNPATALFWDGIHPTAAGHALIASSMLAAVPEPSSMLMLAVGICALLAWRRRA